MDGLMDSYIHFAKGVAAPGSAVVRSLNRPTMRRESMVPSNSSRSATLDLEYLRFIFSSKE
jgi:hypothetical protein